MLRPDIDALEAHFKTTTQGHWFGGGSPWINLDNPERLSNFLFIAGVHNEMPRIIDFIRRLEMERDRFKLDNELLRDYINLCAEKFGPELPFDPTDTGLMSAINPDAE